MRKIKIQKLHLSRRPNTLNKTWQRLDAFFRRVSTTITEFSTLVLRPPKTRLSGSTESSLYACIRTSSKHQALSKPCRGWIRLATSLLSLSRTSSEVWIDDDARRWLIERFSLLESSHRAITATSHITRRWTAKDAGEEEDIDTDEKLTKAFASSYVAVSLIPRWTSMVLSTFVADKRKKASTTKQTSTYLILGFFLSFVGIVLLMVYWRQQSQHRSAVNRMHAAENRAISPTYESPDVDDTGTIENQINNETLMVENDGLTNAL